MDGILYNLNISWVNKGQTMLIRVLSTWFTQTDLWDYCIDPFHVLLYLVSWGSCTCLRGECDLCVLLFRAHSRTQRDSSNHLIPKPPLVQSCHRCTVCPWRLWAAMSHSSRLPASCTAPSMAHRIFLLGWQASNRLPFQQYLYFRQCLLIDVSSSGP